MCMHSYIHQYLQMGCDNLWGKQTRTKRPAPKQTHKFDPRYAKIFVYKGIGASMLNLCELY
jgi:hypothetical protein